MIVSFNGDEGSGKSTIAKKTAKELDYPRYSMGQIFRNMAKKKGITLVELLKFCEKNPEIDKEVDQYLIELSQKEKDFIIESRTAWHFISTSLKIYLKVESKEGAKRIFKEFENNTIRSSEDKGMDSVENIMASEQDRKARDEERYKKYYGINIHDENNYDFVLDTTNLPIDQVLEKTLKFIKSKMNV